VTARSDAGDAIAVIDCAATARRRPDLLDAVARLSGPAVQNARLHEITLARLDEVRASRSRIVSAALEERRRAERDLHDGAQQRLLAVAARLGLARSKAGGPEALAAIDGVREQLRGTLSELRALARDIHPAVLETAGLGAALDVTARRLDFPLTVDVGGERFDSSTEAVAYLTAHELVVDAARFGTVTAASVAATREGRVLRMVVRHDGGGNARTHAIENATDRLRALGGALSIDTVGGGGVVITADVPCE